MRFAVLNLGCKVNRVESDLISAIMGRFASEADIQCADVVIVNTCTVTGEADKKTRKAVRHVLRANERCEVIVTGCASEIAPDVFTALSDRVVVVPKSDVIDHVSRLASAGSLEDPACSGIAEARCGSGFNTRVGIKVQDGCDNACTYCIVHVARGRARSMPVDEVAGECAAFARLGVKEMVLTGINLGSYSCQSGSKRYALHDLLERLLAETERAVGDGDPCRLRLSSIEPNDLSREVVDLMAASGGRICRHLHLPLQSGSSKVLHEMARRYDAQDYLDLVRDLRRAMPQISLTTDVIAGFPGESEDDFEQTVQLARECGFSKMHVFPYSKREGTPAAARQDQVPDDVKAARASRLRQLSDDLRHADLVSREGSTERAVVEKSGTCMTESYYEIPCDYGIPAGKLITITL